MSDQTCAIEGCDQPVKVRDWCNAHYMRWRKYSDPLGGGPPRDMSPIADGTRFGRLVVTGFTVVGDSKVCSRRKYTCACDCGGATIVAGYDLRCGNTQSCGCLAR